MAFLLVSLTMPQVYLNAANSQQLPLPDGNVPVAILYSSGEVWMGGYWTGALFEVNATSDPMTLVGTYYVTGSENHEIGLYGIAQDSNGNLWLSGRSNGEIYKFNINDHTFTGICSAVEPTNLLWFNGNIYVACASEVLKINPSTNEVTEISLPDDNYYGICNFTGNSILVTGIVNCKLVEVDTESNTSTPRVSDLHRPLSVAYNASSGNVYVAENVRWTGDGYENGWTPSIATISSTDWTISSRPDLSSQGCPYAVGVFDGVVVWGSDAEDELQSKTINVLGGDSTPVGEAVYYLAYDGTYVYYSYYGSCGMGKIKLAQGNMANNGTTVGAILGYNDLTANPLSLTIGDSIRISGLLQGGIDCDGTLVELSSFYDGSSYGEVIARVIAHSSESIYKASYEFTWTPAKIGTYRLMAIADGFRYPFVDVTVNPPPEPKLEVTGSLTHSHQGNNWAFFVDLTNLDANYGHDAIVILQVKDAGGRLEKMAFEEISLGAGGGTMVRFYETLHTCKGQVEVYVWKSLDEPESFLRNPLVETIQAE